MQYLLAGMDFWRCHIRIKQRVVHLLQPRRPCRTQPCHLNRRRFKSENLKTGTSHMTTAINQDINLVFADHLECVFIRHIANVTPCVEITLKTLGMLVLTLYVGICKYLKTCMVMLREERLKKIPTAMISKIRRNITNT